MDDPELQVLIQKIRFDFSDQSSSPIKRLLFDLDDDDHTKTEAVTLLQNYYTELVEMILVKNIITRDKYDILKDYTNMNRTEWTLPEKTSRAGDLLKTKFEDLHKRVEGLMNELDSELASTHKIVVDQLVKFIGNDWNDTSLIYSFGFGGAFYQIFPQDSEFVTTYFNGHKKNIKTIILKKDAEFSD
jgi:hypothetical protein